MSIFFSIIFVLFLFVCIFLSSKNFGRLPKGDRLERIEKSPNYRNGEFQNLHETALMTGSGGRWSGMWNFLFGEKNPMLRPQVSVNAFKIDLQHLCRDSNLIVWFGHSSYLIQIEGKRILVDPVFCQASPVSFFNRPFKGADIYKPDDMPDVDVLVITHDHWDHLDHETVTAMKDRIRRVVCPLGVGEHFEYWGFDVTRITELDWNESVMIDSVLTIHCLPARHFSGRGLISNKTLWASFILQTSCRKIYIGGDGGYDTHFVEIGRRFSDINIGIIENGQYDNDWKYIHTMPEQLKSVAKDLGANMILTVHHSKYALSKHPWNEPQKNATMLKQNSFNVLIPTIGEIIFLEE